MKKRKTGISRHETSRVQPGRDRARWCHVIEAASLERRPRASGGTRAALESLPSGEQMRLARELVETRGAEITRAYVDVISVSAGYRLKRNEAGVREVRPEVCIVVVVKKKWKRGERSPAKRQVPAEFFTYATIDGRRVLCAVPTDVEDGRRLARLRPQARITANAPDKTASSADGVIACAVTRDDAVPWAIGCRHVFGLTLILGADGDPGGATIASSSDGGEIGQASSHAGTLANAPAESWDVQLAEVAHENRLAQALDGIVVRDFALTWDDFQQGVDYWIRTDNGPVKAHYVTQHFDPVRYTAHLDRVRHSELARFHLPEGVTHPGDSGSPVMREQTGGKLVGMHIIGDPQERISLVIPSWRLLDPSSYHVNGETWDLWKGLR